MESRQKTLHRYPDSYFPESYLVVDIETTGFSPVRDYIVQFGIVHVEGCEVVSKLSFLVQIPPGSMNEKATEVHGLTEEMCNTQGVPRKDAIYSICNTLTQWVGSRADPVFIGHNAYKFDFPFMQGEFERAGLPRFDLSSCRIIDTGAIVKAEQIGTYPLLEHGETLYEFNDRVLNLRIKGVKWALGEYCMNRFRLQEKMASEGIKTHDATSDCMLTHWVFEKLREERQYQMEPRNA